MSNCTGSDDFDEEAMRTHLDVPDGAGCTEIWSHLSKQRAHDD